jgi:hypothetical protein
MRRVLLSDVFELTAHAAFPQPVDECVGELAPRIALRQPSAQQGALISRVSALRPGRVLQKRSLGHCSALGDTVLDPFSAWVAFGAKV